jgi:hypothetical protein
MSWHKRWTSVRFRLRILINSLTNDKEDEIYVDSGNIYPDDSDDEEIA